MQNFNCTTIFTIVRFNYHFGEVGGVFVCLYQCKILSVRNLPPLKRLVGVGRGGVRVGGGGGVKFGGEFPAPEQKSAAPAALKLWLRRWTGLTTPGSAPVNSINNVDEITEDIRIRRALLSLF